MNIYAAPLQGENNIYMNSKSNPRWKPGEEEKLRCMFALGMSDEQMADRLNRTVLSVCNRRRHLNLMRPSASDLSVENGKKWTEEEDLFIENFWREKTDTWMARKLGVSLRVYKYRRSKLGFKKMWVQKKDRRKSWKFTEEEFLIEHYPTHSAAEIGRRLGKTEICIMMKARRLGLRKAYIPGRRGYERIEDMT